MRKVFLDCGANAGQSLFRFMRHFKDQSEYEIHCFEPNLELHTHIRDKRNHVHVHGVAVWIKNEMIKFYVADHHESSSLMVNKTTGNITDDNYITVKGMDFSRWILETFDKKNFIVLKMNIEGAEYAVLDKMINDGSIDYINSLVVSFHDHKLTGEYDTDGLIKRIQDRGVVLERWTKSLW